MLYATRDIKRRALMYVRSPDTHVRQRGLMDLYFPYDLLISLVLHRNDNDHVTHTKC